MYLVLDLTIELGITTKGDLHIGTALGALLAFPLYVHGLACALVISVNYIEDTWAGHTLVKRFVFGRFNGVLTEWITFFVFLGVPVIVMIITLFAGIDNWWELTAISWFYCICFFYIVFAATIVGIENRACWEVTRNQYDDDDDSWHQVVRRAVLLRQRSFWGGRQHRTYLAKGAFDDGLGADSDDHVIEAYHRTRSSLYSKFIAWKWWSTNGGLGLFEKLEAPERIYNLADVKNERPFVTADTWSLESIYCRSVNSRYVAVLTGPQALTRAQMRSSIVCALLGNFLILLIVAALLVWLDSPSFAILTVVILVVVFFTYPGLKSSYGIFLMAEDLVLAMEGAKQYDDAEVAEEEHIVKAEPAKDEADENEKPIMDSDKIETVQEEPETVEEDPEAGEQAKMSAFTLSVDENEGIYQVWETRRVTTVTELMCWILFGLEFSIFFFWPLYALYLIGNNATATLFFFVALFSALRTYFNAAIVLEETGTLDLVDGEKGSHLHWQKMSRLSIIVTKITRSRGRILWMGILLFVLVAFLGLFGLAIFQEGDTSSDFEFTYLPDFEYVQQDDLNYPTCSFGKGLDALGSGSTDMSDFAYLAALAYRDPSITQTELDQWFGFSNETGSSVAVNNPAFVDEFRMDTDRYKSQVSYKMITFPKVNLAMVCIRGTTNAWDALTDAQLWSAAGIFQGLRILLPLGNIWTPILHRMIRLISYLSSESANRVAFYRQTTQFVEFLQDSNVYDSIQVTGHSLGGGLSIITGAQTGVPAVALSGPNALLSRDSFDPTITKDALNTWTFNIVPDRDIVPRLDDVAKLNQHIRCTAPANDFAACHDGRRSLCEIIYSCGTNNRPALCDCVTEFGYPKPVLKDATSTKTFAEECAALIV